MHMEVDSELDYEVPPPDLKIRFKCKEQAKNTIASHTL